MLPHQHFFIAGIIIALVSLFFPGLSAIGVVKWVLVGGIISALIDIDMAFIVNLVKDKKLKDYKNPKMVFRNFHGFMKVLVKSKALKYAIVSHFSLSFVVVLVFYLFFNFYFVPVLLGVVSHLASDIILIIKARK